MYSGPTFFTAIAEDELYTTTQSEIVDCDAGNTRISEESGPQHSELVIHTSSSSFHGHIGEENAQGRSQQDPGEQVTGSIPSQGPSEQVTGLIPLQGQSEQVSGLISHVASQGPSMQQHQQQEQYRLLQAEQQQQEVEQQHQEHQKQLARGSD